MKLVSSVFAVLAMLAFFPAVSFGGHITNSVSEVVDWTFGVNDEYPNGQVTIQAGCVVEFAWSKDDDAPSHDVRVFADNKGYKDCDFERSYIAPVLGCTSTGEESCRIWFPQPGTYQVGCSIGGGRHCLGGMKLTIIAQGPPRDSFSGCQENTRFLLGGDEDEQSSFLGGDEDEEVTMLRGGE